jgi:hypothetical protein
MSYLASELITRAYYLSGIVAEGFETVSGPQMSTGLSLLNDSLADKISDTSLIPFYKKYETVTEIGEPDYFVPNLLAIETLTFNNGVGSPVRFPMQNVGRDQFRGGGQVDNVASLPSNWHAERAVVDGVGGTTISLYPLPNSAYPLTVWGKFGLTEVAKDDDLSLVYERGYLVYCRYELASMICSEFGISMPEQAERRLMQYRKDFNYISPVDLTVQKASTLYSGRSPDLLAAAFLSGGWVPQ